MQSCDGEIVEDSRASESKVGSAASRSVNWLPLVLAWCAVVHLSSLNGVFTFDDASLLQNESLTEFWQFEWFRLTARPLTTASFAINFTLFGPDPFYCHIGNVIIHVLTVWAVFQVSRVILRSWLSRIEEWESLSTQQFDDYVTKLSLGVALIYGVHPITTTAVTYVVQRGESLGSLFLMLTFWAWSRAFENTGEPSRGSLERPHHGRLHLHLWAVFACLCAFAAYGSKEMTAGLPLMLLAFDWHLRGSSHSPSRWRIKLLYFSIISLPVVLGLVLYVPRILNPGPRATIGVGIEGISVLGYFAFQPRVFLEYVRLLILPVNQVIDYGWVPPESSQSKLVGILAWVGLGACWLFAIRCSRPLGTMGLLVFIWLVPTSTFVPLQDSIFEHRIYLPAAFFVLTVVAMFAVTFRRSMSERSGISRFLVFVCILATVLSTQTFIRNTEYYLDSRLANLEIERQPNNPRAYATRYYNCDDIEDPRIAADLMKTAIRLSEQRNYWYAGTKYKWWRELGDLYFLNHNYGDAEQAYRVALPESHDDLQRAEILLQFALIHSLRGEVEPANERFRECIAIESPIQENARELFNTHLARHEFSSEQGGGQQ